MSRWDNIQSYVQDEPAPVDKKERGGSRWDRIDTYYDDVEAERIVQEEAPEAINYGQWGDYTEDREPAGDFTTVTLSDNRGQFRYFTDEEGAIKPYKEENRPSASIINDIRGGSFADRQAEVDHMISMFLGGTNVPGNLEPLPSIRSSVDRIFDFLTGNVPEYNDYTTEERQSGKYALELELIDRMKSGDLAYPDAVAEIINWETSEYNPNPGFHEAREPIEAGDFFGGLATGLGKAFQYLQPTGLVDMGLDIYGSFAPEKEEESGPMIFEIGEGIGPEGVVTPHFISQESADAYAKGIPTEFTEEKEPVSVAEYETGQAIARFPVDRAIARQQSDTAKMGTLASVERSIRERPQELLAFPEIARKFVELGKDTFLQETPYQPTSPLAIFIFGVDPIYPESVRMGNFVEDYGLGGAILMGSVEALGVVPEVGNVAKKTLQKEIAGIITKKGLKNVTEADLKIVVREALEIHTPLKGKKLDGAVDSYVKEYNKLTDKAVEATTYKAPKPKGVIQHTREAISPLKFVDDADVDLLKGWQSDSLVAKEAANQEAKILSMIPENEGLGVMKAYQKGSPTPYSDDILKAFNKKYDEAIEAGFDVPFRENYLPQVYKNSREDVMEAMGKYLTDMDVPQKKINDYLGGIAELPAEVSAGLKLNPSFTKARAFPDYETAMKYGLTPKYSHPAQLLAHYSEELSTAVGNKKLLDSLIETKKILPKAAAPRDWVRIPESMMDGEGFVSPELGKVLNNLFGERGGIYGGLEKIFHTTGEISGKLQEFRLSGGAPKSTVNFFAISQGIKDLTAGDLKGASSLIKANTNKGTMEFFEANADTIREMAEAGRDLSKRTGAWRGMYRNIADSKISKEQLGKGFDKVFNEKTFMSMMPMQEINTFKHAKAQAIKQGYSEVAAKEIAGETMKVYHGISDQMAFRSQLTNDILKTFFFAPKFRETMIGFVGNTIKSATTQVGNPAYAKNRKYLTGLVISYALYDQLNMALNGHHLKDNPDYRKQSVQIPLPNGDNMFIELAPSILSMPRAAIGLGEGLMKGDVSQVQQKAGSFTSMAAQITFNIAANKDFFGNEIYNPDDDPAQQRKDIAEYVGIQQAHPYISGSYEMIKGDEPFYRSIAKMLELPIKFKDDKAIKKSQGYQELRDLEKETKKKKDEARKKYDEILLIEDPEERLDRINDPEFVTDEEFDIMKGFDSARKSAETKAIKVEIAADYVDMVKLFKSKDFEAVNEMVSKLDDKSYNILVAHNEKMGNKLGEMTKVKIKK